jgi:hypothetical protein
MGGIIKVIAIIEGLDLPINKACVFHQIGLTGRHRSEEFFNIFVSVLLEILLL